ncbi:MAG TPA: o-succinylbenzoate synthase [Rubricoccaceae bacterium]|nr:o-succinylbenzoate synthase [Rubricoccaceae bacterium]
MRIVRHALHPYRLPLREPVTLGRVRIEEREGVLLRLEAEGGAVGWGDAAPLPGFSREFLFDVHLELDAFGGALCGRALDPADVTDPHGRLHAALDKARLKPSARYALDLALWDLAAQATGRSLAEALCPEPVAVLPLNALVTEPPPLALVEAARLAEAGYGTLKLKVGRGALREEVALVRGVRERVGEGVALRLDANRAWTAEEGRLFAAEVAGLGVAYVEEPLRDAEGLLPLWRETRLPVALDETLAEPGGAEALGEWVAAAVLKPTLLGGVSAVLRWAERARAAGVPAVLSAAFESGVGMRGVAALAAATGGEAAGLDPYRRLAADVLAEPLPLDRPTVDVQALLTRPLEVRLR